MKILILLSAIVLSVTASGYDRAPGRSVGRSMLPTLPIGCRILVVRIPFEEVKVGPFSGDIISTRQNGEVIVHRAIGRDQDGNLITQGDNNPKPDKAITTALNYVGVVTSFQAFDEKAEPAPPPARKSR